MGKQNPQSIYIVDADYIIGHSDLGDRRWTGQFRAFGSFLGFCLKDGEVKLAIPWTSIIQVEYKEMTNPNWKGFFHALNPFSQDFYFGIRLLYEDREVHRERDMFFSTYGPKIAKNAVTIIWRFRDEVIRNMGRFSNIDRR